MISWCCCYELIGKQHITAGRHDRLVMTTRKQRTQEEKKGLKIPVKRHTANALTPSRYTPTLKVSSHHLLRALRLSTRSILHTACS